MRTKPHRLLEKKMQPSEYAKMPNARVGVIGYSAQPFNKEDATHIIREAFATLRRKYKITEVVSGLTNLGIPALAYRYATLNNFRTKGIACKKAEEFEIYPVDECVIVGDNWGDESQTFLSSIDILVRIGGGPQSKKEFDTFQGTKYYIPLKTTKG